jgi:hypothetical protein
VSGLADPGHMAGDRVSPAATAPTPEAEPGRSHLQPAALIVHAHVYAAVWADSFREYPTATAVNRADVANRAADSAATLYKPWPVTP